MYAVILAGGGGTRLRPLSHDDRPKPFLPLLGERTLIQETVERVKWLVEGAVYVVTDARYEDLVHEQVPDVTVLCEPVGRNTAAAIALAAVAIDRPAHEVMIVLPADHAITEPGIFERVLESAGKHLAPRSFGVADPLVTLGIQIDRPATEYGYLLPNLDLGEPVDGMQAYPLAGFEEKPTIDRAADLYASGGGTAWNAGMFLWRRRAIRRALRAYTPMPMTSETRLRAVYADLEAVSIDYAVMEPAAREGRVVMAAMDVGWSDIGSWTALLSAIGARGSGRVVQAGETATLSADDLAIVRTEDGVAIETGPGTIAADGPIAVLTGAAPDRDRVALLIDRVTAMEARAS